MNKTTTSDMHATQKRPDAITAIAVYHFIAGGVMALGGLMLTALGALPITLFVMDPMVRYFGFLGIGIVAILPLAIGIFMLFVGKGLLDMRNWARWCAIVLAVLSLPGFPIGTVAGILILIYLIKEDTAKLFEGSDV